MIATRSYAYQQTHRLTTTRPEVTILHFYLPQATTRNSFQVWRAFWFELMIKIKNSLVKREVGKKVVVGK